MNIPLPLDQPDLQEGYLPLEQAQLSYRTIGQGLPLLLLHGGPSFDHHYLLPDMDHLADAFRLIYYDQRGRGTSVGKVDPAQVSIQSEMDDLEYVRAYFQLERAALLGHSWGGLLALEYALRHPERVSHLVLLNTAPASHEDCMLFEQERDSHAPDDAVLVRELESSPAYAEGDLAVSAAANRAYFRATLRSPELLDRLIEHVHTGWTQEDVLRARAIGNRYWGETYESTGYDLLPKLKEIHIPTLVLHGDYDFVPVACAAHIAEAILAARLVVLSDCGHFSYLERPGAVRNALSAFFQAS